MDASPPFSPASPGREHLPRLDAVRGIAILMVVLFHTCMFTPETPAEKVFSAFINAFSQGVPLFFVLSGFLISTIVFEDWSKFGWTKYAQRRVAKIIPPFVLSLAFYALKDFRHAPVSQTAATVLANLATLPNFTEHWRLLNPVSWSLLVEIHFYLLLPLLFLCWRAASPRHAERLTLACFLFIPPIFRAVNWLTPVGSIGERFFLLCRFPCAMDFFAWGMLFSHLYRQYRNHAWLGAKAPGVMRAGLWLLPLFLALYTALPLLLQVGTVLHKPAAFESMRLLICLATFGMLFCAWPQAQPGGVAGKIFDSRLLQYVGLVSYEWFLFHPAIIFSARYHLAKALSIEGSIQSKDIGLLWFFLLSVVSVLLSFLICAGIYHWFSQPLLKAIKNFSPGKRTPGGAVPRVKVIKP